MRQDSSVYLYAGAIYFLSNMNLIMDRSFTFDKAKVIRVTL